MNVLPQSTSDGFLSSASAMSHLTRHPLDPDVRVGQTSISNAIDIVKARRAKAVIIPFSDKENLSLQAQNLTKTIWSTLQEKTAIHRRGESLNAPNIGRVPSWVQNEMRHVFNELNNVQCQKREELVLLTDAPTAGHEGFAPYIHNHNSIDLHLTLFGAALEWSKINVAESGMTSAQIAKYPYLEETIISAEIGDLIIFGADFWHRSSARIPEEGRISIMKPELRF